MTPLKETWYCQYPWPSISWFPPTARSGLHSTSCIRTSAACSGTQLQYGNHLQLLSSHTHPKLQRTGHPGDMTIINIKVTAKPKKRKQLSCSTRTATGHIFQWGEKTVCSCYYRGHRRISQCPQAEGPPCSCCAFIQVILGSKLICGNLPKQSQLCVL